MAKHHSECLLASEKEEGSSGMIKEEWEGVLDIVMEAEEQIESQGTVPSVSTLGRRE